MNPVFEVVLEKKGRGRGFSLSRPWAVRNFKLATQTLEYYDQNKLKGTIDITNAKVYLVEPSAADGKPFPFVVDTEAEKLYLNATSDSTRRICLNVFSRAAEDKDWRMPMESTVTTSAAIAILKEEVEKSKLQAELVELEKERIEEETEAVSSVFAEELANKALREAKEAEERQKEEQEREVMQLLKSLGIKQKLKAAIKHHRWGVARDCAAILVQNAYRAKLSHRRMVLAKQAKEALKREGYARRIQSRYRMRLAYRQVQKIKLEKQRIKERLAALRIQSRWRVFLAHRYYQRKQEQKLEAEYNRSIQKMRGLIRFQTAVRKFLAISRLAAKRKFIPTVVFLTYEKVEGFNFPPCGYVDLGVIVSGCVLISDTPIKRYKSSAIQLIQNFGKITSHYKIETHSQSTRSGLVTSLHQMDYIIVTAYDKKNENELLGQAIVKVTDIRDTAKITNSLKIEIDVKFAGELIIPILDENNQPLVHYRNPTVGHVSLLATLSNPNYTMAGWVWKISESLLSNAWKRRWFVLSDGHLTYYNTDLHLDASKNTINCADIISIQQESNEEHRGRNNYVKIVFVINGNESTTNEWFISFDECDTTAVRQMWIRKLKRNAIRLPNEDIPPKLVKTHSSKRVKRQSVFFEPEQKNGVTSPVAKTHIPVAKRMSIFK